VAITSVACITQPCLAVCHHLVFLSPCHRCVGVKTRQRTFVYRLHALPEVSSFRCVRDREGYLLGLYDCGMGNPRSAGHFLFVTHKALKFFNMLKMTCLLECFDVYSCRNRPTFKRCLLPPSSGLIPEDGHLHICCCENLNSHFQHIIGFMTVIYLMCKISRCL
jgi:hypothetical protein